MNLFFLTTFFIGLAFVGIAIKILIKKNGKFSGTCASQNLYLNKETDSCGICGAKIGESCKD